jgi:ABC-type transport system involved in cytochrome c biogenesis permease subunit
MQKQKREIYFKKLFAGIVWLLPCSLAGIFLIIVIMFLIFAKESLKYLSDIMWSFVILGIVALAFFYSFFKKKERKKK